MFGEGKEQEGAAGTEKCSRRKVCLILNVRLIPSTCSTAIIASVATASATQFDPAAGAVASEAVG